VRAAARFGRIYHGLIFVKLRKRYVSRLKFDRAGAVNRDNGSERGR